MTELHYFPDGSTFERNSYTRGGHRIGHDITTDCYCLPLTTMRDNKFHVVHVPDWTIST